MNQQSHQHQPSDQPQVSQQSLSPRDQRPQPDESSSWSIQRKTALIGAAATLLAAIIGGIFLVITNQHNIDHVSTPTPVTCSPQAETPTATTSIVSALPIYVGKFADNYKLSAGTIDANNTPIPWVVTDKGGEIRMAYPSGQKSGLVSITVGPSTSPPRPGQDLSKYRTLSLELCGQVGNESVVLGLKDNKDLHPGETEVTVSGLTTSWETREFDLSSFADVDLHNVYVVTEFIFRNIPPETVYVRNIQYLP